MYLSPPEASILGAKTGDLPLKPNIDAALNVLQEHYDKINPVKVSSIITKIELLVWNIMDKYYIG